MERIDYEKMADYDDIHNRMLDGEAISPLGQFILDNEPADGRLAREFRSGLLEAIRYIATAAAEAQREACYDHTLQTFGCVETARIVRETKLITESEAK